jgi:hypothetical protein
MINNPVCGVQRNNEERKCQKRAALVFIHGHSQIAKTSAEESVRKIEPTHWVDVTARGVNGGFVRRQRAKQIIKAGRQIAQTGAQVQNIWRRKYRDATWLENTINFPDDLSIIFQVLNRFDTGNEREAIITVWKRFAIQIDGMDLDTRNGEQFIRVIASEGTKRIMSSNQAQ